VSEKRRITHTGKEKALPVPSMNEITQQPPTSSLASSSTQVVGASQSPCSSLTNSACSDANLVKLLRSMNEQQIGSNTQEQEINQYIQEISVLYSNSNSELEQVQ
jgi:hypothetical protein